MSWFNEIKLEVQRPGDLFGADVGEAKPMTDAEMKALLIDRLEAEGWTHTGLKRWNSKNEFVTDPTDTFRIIIDKEGDVSTESRYIDSRHVGKWYGARRYGWVKSMVAKLEQTMADLLGLVVEHGGLSGPDSLRPGRQRRRVGRDARSRQRGGVHRRD